MYGFGPTLPTGAGSGTPDADEDSDAEDAQLALCMEAASLIQEQSQSAALVFVSLPKMVHSGWSGSLETDNRNADNYERKLQILASATRACIFVAGSGTEQAALGGC